MLAGETGIAMWVLASSPLEVERVLSLFLVQLIVIILAARLGGWLFRQFGQPQVVGEILAGLLLGPSCLGGFAPDVLAGLFPQQTDTLTRVFGQLALVFLMFEVGLEFDFKHLREIGQTAAAVAVAGIVLPFGLGFGMAWLAHGSLAPAVDRVGFSLFVATALSITAIPILGRIMLEFGLQRVPVGVLTISAAAVDDALGWILLAAVSGIVTGGLEWGSLLARLAGIALFLAVMWWGVRPLLLWLYPRRGEPLGEQESITWLSVLLIAAFLSALATTQIGVFAIFGPFVLGAVLSEHEGIRLQVRRQMHDFLSTVMLPVFFTFTGLRTNIGLLDSWPLWGWCLLISLVAIGGKMVGCGLAARWGGCSWSAAGIVATMMNTRALMGMIAINIGRDLNVIPDVVFSMLVIMALVTTVMTTPLLRWLLAADPLMEGQLGVGPLGEPASTPGVQVEAGRPAAH